MKRHILVFIFGMLLPGMAALAHHSISGVYDTEKEITVEGVVREFRFVNPHPFLTVEVKNASGIAQNWQLEMDNRSELTELGMTKDTLKRGDRIVVKGHPGSSQKESLYVRRLDRPSDGFRYEQIGSTPKINFKPL